MNVDSVKVGLDEFTLAESSETKKIFQNDADDLLIILFFPNPDPPPYDLSDIVAMRRFSSRLAAEKGGGVVEANIFELDGVPTQRIIYKFPQQPSGITFMGFYSMHVDDVSFVLKIQCEETGMTGFRETLVATKLKITDRSKWMRDPYDPNFDGPVLATLADAPKWDELFPDHPLSRCRRTMTVMDSNTKIIRA